MKQEYHDEEESSYCEHSMIRYRKDENALPEAESDRDYKFIKKEDPQEGPVYREDSMAPYRQSSPFILHRSE